MTIYGWDASNYDWTRGPMDLAAARAAGIDWFTHKATEGVSVVHEQFGEAMRRAAAAGVPVLGGYHVVRTGPAPARQADHLLATADRLWPAWRRHPCWFWQVDLEKWPYDPVSAAAGIAFGNALAARTDRRIVVYASRGQYGSTLAGCPYELWNAAYGRNEAGPFRDLYPGDSSARWSPYSGRTPVFLQYTSNAVIGRQHICDANAYRGTVEQLKAFIGGGPVRPDAAPQPKRRPPMLMLGRTKTNTFVWVSDGFKRRPVNGAAEMNALLAMGVPWYPWVESEADLFAVLGPAGPDAAPQPVFTDAQAAALGDRLVAHLDAGGIVTPAALRQIVDEELDEAFRGGADADTPAGG